MPVFVTKKAYQLLCYLSAITFWGNIWEQDVDKYLTCKSPLKSLQNVLICPQLFSFEREKQIKLNQYLSSKQLQIYTFSLII